MKRIFAMLMCASLVFCASCGEKAEDTKAPEPVQENKIEDVTKDFSIDFSKPSTSATFLRLMLSLASSMTTLIAFKIDLLSSTLYARIILFL